MSLNTHKILDLRDVDNSGLIEQSRAYAELLSHWNLMTNLVSTGNVDNLLVNLINESISLLQYEPLAESSAVLDVGSGAGIPAFPLKFARPDLKMVLVEGRRMKAAFLRRVIEELSLKDITVVHDRVVPGFKIEDWRNQFDLVTSRGVGKTPELFETVKPYLKKNGRVCFFKGSSVRKDADDLAVLTEAEIRRYRVSGSITLLIAQP